MPTETSAWRRAFPLLVLALAPILFLLVLPSALNLPQANPTETLEYAPVPPDEDTPPPATPGNLSSLGLGGSDSLSDLAGLDDLIDVPPPKGKTPSTKRCVGNPPRQTEDPQSPPCVAHFEGDNFGATYSGVTREEVRILFYFEGISDQQGSSRGQEPDTSRKYFDLAQPPTDDEHVWVRMLRLYQRYFNDRFQTYNRNVHFWAYYGPNTGTNTPETRQADAADNYARIRPFAVYNQGNFGFTEVYTEAMAKRGVLVFTGAQNSRLACCFSAESFRRFAKLLWGVAASTEQWARINASLVCNRVVGRPVTYSGNVGDNGQPRKLGMIVNRRTGYDEEPRLAAMMKEQIQACGGTIAAEITNTGFPCNFQGRAQTDMLELKNKGVTTIIWPAGPSPGAQDCYGAELTHASAALGYLPEVVIAGDGTENVFSYATLNSTFSRNIFILTSFTRADVFDSTPCVQAAREVDPAAPRIDLLNFACELYDGVRLLFTGIQVSGPRLGPTSMDKGFHAIPAIRSDDPRVPACFFETDDYTCVKDGMLERFDPGGRDPGSSLSGCFRMAEGGRRYLAGAFPSRDIAAGTSRDDPCNHQGFTSA